MKGVIIMNNILNQDVPTLRIGQEIWDQQQLTAVFVKVEVVLLIQPLPPTLSIYQILWFHIQRSSVWTRPTGRMLVVVNVKNMNNSLLYVLTLVGSQEIWDLQLKTVAIAGGVRSVSPDIFFL